MKTDNPEWRKQTGESFNPFDYQVLKVSLHDSKRGTALKCAETLDAEYATLSFMGSSALVSPHEIPLMSPREETDRTIFMDYPTPAKLRLQWMVSLWQHEKVAMCFQAEYAESCPKNRISHDFLMLRSSHLRLLQHYFLSTRRATEPFAVDMNGVRTTAVFVRTLDG